MRSFGPLPLTRLRSTPSSRANLRTDGLACASVWSPRFAGRQRAVAVPRRRRRTAQALPRPARPSTARFGDAPPVAGAAAGFAAAGAGAVGAAGAAPAPSSIASTSPLLILSPTLTFSSFTTPPADDGISIDALSLSIVTSDCSAAIVSPTFTSTSMTSTSLKSPMSGTLDFDARRPRATGPARPAGGAGATRRGLSGAGVASDGTTSAFGGLRRRGRRRRLRPSRARCPG